MAKDVTIVIRAKEAVTNAVNKTKKAFTGLVMGAKKMTAGIAAAFRKMRAGMVAMGVGAAALAVTLKKAFEFESYTTQFKVLFDDLDKAKERIKDLQDFSASTPFQFGEIAQASRSLEVFTGGVMGATDSLKLVGDAAAGTGQNIKDVSFWVGRAYGAIRSGRPFGEAAMRLQEMGILSGEARGQIEDLTKAGASNAEIWEVLQDQMTKFEGGMQEMSTTGDGLTSTLKDNWSLALADFGKTFVDVAKQDIAVLIEWLKKVREDGSIEKWATSAVKAIKKVGAAAKASGRFVVELGGWVD